MLPFRDKAGAALCRTTIRGKPKVVKIALFAAALAAAAPPRPIPVATPVAKWVVDFAPEHCTASHTYMADGAELVVAIQPVPTRDTATLLIQAPRKLTTWESEAAEVHIGSDRIELGGRVRAEPVVKPGFSRYVIGLKRENYEKLLATGRLTFNGQHLRAQFNLQNLAALSKVLAQCNRTLLESWGLPADAQAALASFPEPKNPSAIFNPNDYPNRAANRGAIGEVHALTSVDSAGRVTGCRIMRSSGHADLDEATCEAIRKRGRFSPALDRTGKPMASPYLFTTRWLVSFGF